MNCKETCKLPDDHGDNETTIHCQLPAGHKGPHKEKFEVEELEDWRTSKIVKKSITVTWEAK
jgi:hypothetical protein